MRSLGEINYKDTNGNNSNSYSPWAQDRAGTTLRSSCVLLHLSLPRALEKVGTTIIVII